MEPGLGPVAGERTGEDIRVVIGVLLSEGRGRISC
jgi:hypothetical protein